SITFIPYQESRTSWPSLRIKQGWYRRNYQHEIMRECKEGWREGSCVIEWRKPSPGQGTQEREFTINYHLKAQYSRRDFSDELAILMKRISAREFQGCDAIHILKRIGL